MSKSRQKPDRGLLAGAVQRLAVERDQIGRIGPQISGVGHETGLEHRRVDPVEHHCRQSLPWGAG